MKMKMFAAVAMLATGLLVGLVASAGAKPKAAGPIHYGVADDGGKYADDPGSWFSALTGGGLTQARWTLAMNQSNPAVISELPFIQRAAPVAQGRNVRIIISLTAPTVKDLTGNVLFPSAITDPTAFCTWAALVANTVKQWGIHDFIIGNEVNTAVFFAPQDASAPAKYEALLAKCYDTIHAADSSANVIGFGLSPRSNGPSQTAPLTFLKAAGQAYVDSHRQGPIMDQLAIHPYPNPNSPTDSPDVGYPAANPQNANNYGIPDLARVKQAVYDAFKNTGQPTTLNGLTFLIDELGWQTDTRGYGAPYIRTENVPVVSEQTQSDYIKTSIQKYFACDPTVTDVEFFLLQDEPSRDGKDANGNPMGGGWQSGFMTAAGQPKPSYTQDAPLFGQGRAACTGSQITWAPAGTTTTTSTTTTTTTTTGGTTPGVCESIGDVTTLSDTQKLKCAGPGTPLYDIAHGGGPNAAAALAILTLVNSQFAISTQLNTLIQQILSMNGTAIQDILLKIQIILILNSFTSTSLNSNSLTSNSFLSISGAHTPSRAPAILSPKARYTVMASGAAKIVKGARITAKVKPRRGAKARYGTYYLLETMTSASNPTQKYSVAVKLVTVKKPVKKPVKNPAVCKKGQKSTKKQSAIGRSL